MNHRMGLFDMIMLKDNHIDYAGGIENAILSTRDYLQKNNLNLRVEIEARSVGDVRKITCRLEWLTALCSTISV